MAFLRGTVAQALPGAAVQLGSDPVAVVSRETGHGGARCQVLAPLTAAPGRPCAPCAWLFQRRKCTWGRLRLVRKPLGCGRGHIKAPCTTRRRPEGRPQQEQGSLSVSPDARSRVMVKVP